MARSRRNPVQEIIQQTHVAPGHTVLEWVDVDDGQWIDAREINSVRRRPPHKPGKHLVTTGAQLLFMVASSDSVDLLFSRALFVKDKHHWEYLDQAGPKVVARIEGNSLKLLSPASERDLVVMRLLLAYEQHEAKEHTPKQLTRSSRSQLTSHAMANPSTRPDWKYVAIATDRRGQTHTWHGRTLEIAMANADREAHPALEITVRTDATSDGTYWGEGRGRVVAARERGRWFRSNPSASSSCQQARYDREDLIAATMNYLYEVGLWDRNWKIERHNSSNNAAFILRTPNIRKSVWNREFQSVIKNLNKLANSFAFYVDADAVPAGLTFNTFCQD